MSDLLITTIQTNLHWEDKKNNLAMLEEKLAQLPATEIVVLPEMFTTGFSMRPNQLAETMQGATVEWMVKMASRHRIILTGSLIIEEDGEYFNRLLWVLPNGQLGYYNKRHLFAYADEHQHYQAGEKRLIASVKGWKINLLVCYDLRFPVWSRQQKKDENNGAEYDVLIYVANWPQRRSLAWKTLLQARAIENQCYVVGVNRVGQDGNDIVYSGDSMIIDPLGEVLYHAPAEEAIFTNSLSRDHLDMVRSKFPFLRDADDFMINL
jgi:omega-amidase